MNDYQTRFSITDFDCELPVEARAELGARSSKPVALNSFPLRSLFAYSLHAKSSTGERSAVDVELEPPPKRPRMLRTERLPLDPTTKARLILGGFAALLMVLGIVFMLSQLPKQPATLQQAPATIPASTPAPPPGWNSDGSGSGRAGVIGQPRQAPVPRATLVKLPAPRAELVQLWHPGEVIVMRNIPHGVGTMRVRIMGQIDSVADLPTAGWRPQRSSSPRWELPTFSNASLLPVRARSRQKKPWQCCRLKT